MTNYEAMRLMDKDELVEFLSSIMDGKAMRTMDKDALTEFLSSIVDCGAIRIMDKDALAKFLSSIMDCKKCPASEKLCVDAIGISDDYAYLAGNIYEPHIETLIIGKDDNMYYEKEDSPYDDCCHYYGWKEVDNWSDEEIEEKAKAIPWEDVIAVSVGVN